MSLFQLCAGRNTCTKGRLKALNMDEKDITISCTEIKYQKLALDEAKNIYVFEIPYRKDVDKIKPTHLVIRSISGTSPEEFLRAYTYEIQTNKLPLFSIPFTFLLQLNPLYRMNDVWVIPVPFDDFWNDWLYTGSTEYLPLSIVIKPNTTASSETTTEPALSAADVIITQYYKSMVIDITERKSTDEKQVFLNQLIYHGLLREDGNIYSYTEESFSGMIKGFFLESDDPLDLVSLKISLCYYSDYLVRQDYDQIMLELYANKISDKLIYIPLDDAPYNETGPLSSVNALYMRRSFVFPGRGINMKIEASRSGSKGGKLRIYYLQANTMIYRDGMCNMKYHM